MSDGEMQPVEAVGLLAVYAILGATIWAEGALGGDKLSPPATGAAGSGSFSPTTTPSSSQTPMRRNFSRLSARRCSIGSASIESSARAIASPSRRAARS